MDWQIADAVVVAAQLKASLVLPNVKEAAKEPNRFLFHLHPLPGVTLSF